MDWPILALFAAVIAWAALRVLGGERQRRVHELQIRMAVQAAEVAAADAPAPLKR